MLWNRPGGHEWTWGPQLWLWRGPWCGLWWGEVRSHQSDEDWGRDEGADVCAGGIPAYQLRLLPACLSGCSSSTTGPSTMITRTKLCSHTRATTLLSGTRYRH